MLDNPPHGIRGFVSSGEASRRRRGARRTGDHHVGVAVRKHVLDEFLRRQAGEMASRGLAVGQSAACFGRPLESGFGATLSQPPSDRRNAPGSSKMNSPVSSVAAAACGSAAASDGRSKNPASARRRHSRHEREKRARRAASRGDEEIAATPERSAANCGSRLLREAIGRSIGRESGTGTKSPLLVESSLTRQAYSVRIDEMARRFHQSSQVSWTGCPSKSVREPSCPRARLPGYRTDCGRAPRGLPACRLRANRCPCRGGSRKPR